MSGYARRAVEAQRGSVDKGYARDMVKDHRKDIAEFQKEANNGKDQNVKNSASQTVPTRQEHRKLAEHMLHSVEGSTRASGSPSGTQ
jgi:putative membrane protein